MYAVEGLGNIGEPALKTMPLLKRASLHSDDFLAEEAQKSLDKLTAIEKIAVDSKKPEAQGDKKLEKNVEEND